MRPENVWVLICTYRRPEQLGALLDSLRRVDMPEGTDLEQPQVIVVDNAERPSAAEVVRRVYPRARFLHEPRPGIASARNASLEAVPESAEAVIFVDDDEQVTPGWFTALLAAAESSGADAVSGPVLPQFLHGEPAWVAEYGYVRRTDFPTGPHQRRLATNNTLVRAEWFTRRGWRFDETFNFAGGSDSDLFERMLRDGARFFWCAEAVVTEQVPAERASKEWLRRRAVRGGRVRAMKLRRRTAAVPAAVRTAAEGLARCGYGSLRRAGKRLRGRPITYTDDYYLCEGLGMLGSLTGAGRDEYGRPA
ncbi:glycosyltransferase family 2 protein [Nesterenkonia sp.]|uniref:glycosyltransferase family 2 protein n=1 Tax=Nesterenkonia sp. TaxID=704201 RepID=UPI002628CDC2|nr:glycosyltransferase family 2 protein [Nesterenkonia sp.]